MRRFNLVLYWQNCRFWAQLKFLFCFEMIGQLFSRIITGNTYCYKLRNKARKLVLEHNIRDLNRILMFWIYRWWRRLHIIHMALLPFSAQWVSQQCSQLCAPSAVLRSKQPLLEVWCDVRCASRLITCYLCNNLKLPSCARLAPQLRTFTRCVFVLKSDLGSRV